MIQNQTILNVVDNSGVKTVYCIKVGKGFKQRYAFVGDTILVSVKSFRRKKRRIQKSLIKGFICKALIVRTKSSIIQSLENFKFLENSVVLLNKQTHKNIFTRVFGPVLRSLRYSKYMKIITLSSGII